MPFGFTNSTLPFELSFPYISLGLFCTTLLSVELLELGRLNLTSEAEPIEKLFQLMIDLAVLWSIVILFATVLIVALPLATLPPEGRAVGEGADQLSVPASKAETHRETLPLERILKVDW